MIQADSLFKRYGTVEAVRGVSFRVDTGSIVGLLGPNGAGKTSLMRILTCYHFPSSGAASVEGHDVTSQPDKVRRVVGYLPENAPSYEDMKAGDYLKFIGTMRGMPRPRLRERIDWAVQTCGLSPVFTREIRKLSKGFRQRVGLAQAMLHDPPVLILDEPTTGLDPNQILEIRALIRGLGASKTVLLSTHILQEVEALCRRVLILNAGKLIAQGTSEEIARDLKEGVVLSVSIKGAPPQGLQEELAALPGVRGVSAVRSQGEDRTEVDLAVAAGADPSESVYDWAVKKGHKILGMSKQRATLEELFARLTKAADE
ncbi:MAG: ATP-binding cassette domain-containing protein [Spirochaetia bacterium]|jgi:ABC-2 type transport system ATP-binding protein